MVLRDFNFDDEFDLNFSPIIIKMATVYETSDNSLDLLESVSYDNSIES